MLSDVYTQIFVGEFVILMNFIEIPFKHPFFFSFLVLHSDLEHFEDPPPKFEIISLQYSNGLVSRVFANGPEDLGSIPGHVIPKTLKRVLDTS